MQTMNDNLPKGWTIAKLGDICFTTSGGTPSRKMPNYYGGNIPWVKSGELDKGLILDTEEKITEEAIKNSSAKVFPKGTLLIALYGATVGKLAFLGIDATTNQAVCGIYKSEAIESKLLYYFLLLQKSNLVSQSIGGAQPNISQGIIKDLIIPLAPLNEQKRILAKLEQLLTDLDKGIEYLETTKQQIKIYRQAVLKWAFEGIKEFTNLNDVGSWMGGGTPSTQNKEYWNGGNVLWVSSQDVKSKYINDTERKITELAIENSSTKWIKKDSLLFVVRSGILRRIFPIAIAQKDLCVNQDIQTLSLNDNYHTEFVYWYLLGNESAIRYKCAKDGTTVESIDVQKLKNYQIPKANLDTQIKVIQEIESRLSVCDKIEETIESSLQQAEALRLSIIKKAFEGKLVPQDPNDEPAEKLLERIRALRQSSTKLTSRAQGKQGKEKPEKKEKVKAEKKPAQKRNEKIEI